MPGKDLDLLEFDMDVAPQLDLLCAPPFLKDNSNNTSHFMSAAFAMGEEEQQVALFYLATEIELDREPLLSCLAQIEAKQALWPQFLRSNRTCKLVDGLRTCLEGSASNNEVFLLLQEHFDREAERWFNWSAQEACQKISGVIRIPKNRTTVLERIFSVHRYLKNNGWQRLMRWLAGGQLAFQRLQKAVTKVREDLENRISDFELVHQNSKEGLPKVVADYFNLFACAHVEIMDFDLDEPEAWQALLYSVGDLFVYGSKDEIERFTIQLKNKLLSFFEKDDYFSVLSHEPYQNLVERLRKVKWEDHLKPSRASDMEGLLAILMQIEEEKCLSYLAVDECNLEQFIVHIQHLDNMPVYVESLGVGIQAKMKSLIKKNALPSVYIKPVLSGSGVLTLGGKIIPIFDNSEWRSFRKAMQTAFLSLMEHEDFASFKELEEFLSSYCRDELFGRKDDFGARLEAVFLKKAGGLVARAIKAGEQSSLNTLCGHDFRSPRKLCIDSCIEPALREVIQENTDIGLSVADAIIDGAFESLASEDFKVEHPRHAEYAEEAACIAADPLHSNLCVTVALRLRKYLTHSELSDFTSNMSTYLDETELACGGRLLVEAFTELVAAPPASALEESLSELLDACPVLMSIQESLETLSEKAIYTLTKQEHHEIAYKYKDILKRFDSLYLPEESRKHVWMRQIVESMAGSLACDFIESTECLPVDGLQDEAGKQAYLHSYIACLNAGFKEVQTRFSSQHVHAHLLQGLTAETLKAVATMRQNLEKLEAILNVLPLQPSPSIDKALITFASSLNTSAINYYKHAVYLVTASRVANGQENTSKPALVDLRRLCVSLESVMTKLEVLSPHAFLLSHLKAMRLFLLDPSQVEICFNTDWPEKLNSFDMAFISHNLVSRYGEAREMWFGQFKEKVESNHYNQQVWTLYARFLGLPYSFQDVSAIVLPYDLDMSEIMAEVNSLEEFSSLLNLLHCLVRLMPDNLSLGTIKVPSVELPIAEFKGSKFFPFLKKMFQNNQVAMLRAMQRINSPHLLEERLLSIYDYLELLLDKTNEPKFNYNVSRQLDRFIALLLSQPELNHSPERIAIMTKMAKLASDFRDSTVDSDYARIAAGRLLAYLTCGNGSDNQLYWDAYILINSDLVIEKHKVIEALYDPRVNKAHRVKLETLLSGSAHQHTADLMSSVAAFFVPSPGVQGARKNILADYSQHYVNYWLTEVEHQLPYERLCIVGAPELSTHLYILMRALGNLSCASIEIASNVLLSSMSEKMMAKSQNSYGMQIFANQSKLGIPCMRFSEGSNDALSI